jgi:tRNA(Ile)-lysidine synthase
MIANAISGISGKTFYSSSHRACLDRDFLFIFPRSDKKINKDTPCFVANDDSEIFEPVRLVFEKKPFTANWQPVTNPDIEQFDWEKLTFPLEIRRPIRGDYFYPLGLGGKKKLSDFFVDLKLTTIEKSDIFVLTSAGNIIWVIGYRADDRFKITPSTKDIFQINLIRS